MRLRACGAVSSLFKVSSGLGKTALENATTQQTFIGVASQPFLRSPQKGLVAFSLSPAAPLFMRVVALWRLKMRVFRSVGDQEGD